MRRGVVVGALLCLAASGCAGRADRRSPVTVFAASSLSDAFDAMAKPFADSQDRYSVRFSFAGSQQLASQVQQGAPVDVLATADRPSMQSVQRATARPPAVFAGNRLVIAVRAGNPKAVSGLADLARSDIRVVLAAPQVPAGRYARQALAMAGVAVSPVSLEDNVGGVVTKVGLGEADAGIVYVTDVRGRGKDVQAVAIPEGQNVSAEYLIAPLRAAHQRAGASAFVSFVQSSEGQAVLRRLGFLPPP
ncbi:MAG: modA [Acidimicrobiales bacterium]|nr:modA [Acidimicrobiales bacterium]